MLTDKDEIKIFILYLMNTIKYPLDYDTLHDVCVCEDYITSFDFIEGFDELLALGNIEKKADAEGKEKISLTEKGVYIAENLNGKLLLSVKEKSLKSALRLISFEKRGTKCSKEAIELPHGKYEFTCSLEEKGSELMKLTLQVDNKKQLEQIMYNFDYQPEYIYRGILALIAGEASYLLD